MASKAQLLQRAVEFHQAGDRVEAEGIYRDILRIEPRHADALHLLGVAVHQSGQHQAATDYIERAIALNGANAAYHSNLAAACRANGESDKAESALREAIHLDPNFADAHYNLGTVLKEKGDADEAIVCFQRSLALNPQSVETHNNLGVLYQQQGDPHAAVAEFQKALEIKADHAEALNNLGAALLQGGRAEEAVRYHERAVQVRPDFAGAYFNLGNAHRDLGRLNDAEACYRRAHMLERSSADVLNNLGLVLLETGRLEEALACFEQVLRLHAEHVEAHVNRSHVLCSRGDFERGWPEYEWRFLAETFCRSFAEPRWDGSPLGNRTILLHGEQGIGDEIQFATVIPEIAAAARECLVECDKRLVPLFARSFPQVRVFAAAENRAPVRNDSLPPFDVQIPLGSTMQFVRKSFAAFPDRSHYLVADSQLLEKWRRRYVELNGELKIGISWRGGNDRELQRRRSAALSDWLPILSQQNATFINLQYGDCRGEIEQIENEHGIRIHDWDDSDPLADLDDFAAKIAALDLVISVDNSTVHLAGALGAPTWTLLPFSADWRWFLDRDDSPWYPSMRLLRQQSRGDWSGAMQETTRLLGKRLLSVCEECPERESPPPPSIEPAEGQDDDRWLKRNLSLRGDPRHPNFPADRRAFIVRRYEFAREFCTGKRVLDAACGTGFGSAILGEAAADVCGIDLDAKTVAYAAGHYGSRKVRFQQSCVELTPFAASDFEVIVSLETIEHTIAPHATMSELVRLLNDDGVLILSVPNAWGLTRHHFVDFDFSMLKELTQQFFAEQEFYYNNSAASGPGTPRGIGPLDEIDPADAECLLAVCRKPRKHLVPAEVNRVQTALEQIYSSAFRRHVDYLSTQIRVGPFGISTDGELPQVFSGATLQMQADDFGDELGRVICQLESPILEWSPQSVTVQIPDVRLQSSVPAQLDVVSADGEVIASTAIRFVPNEETARERLADSA